MLLTVLGLATVVASPAQARQRFTCDYWNVLCTGQRIIDGRHTWVDMETRDRRFSLGIIGGTLELTEHAPITKERAQDDSVWAVGDYDSIVPRSRTTLTMQRNGNLVLRTHAGRMLWASHTTGTGRHNRLVLQRNGDLVIRTGAGRAVWRSHTGHAELIPGEQVESGRSLVNRYESLYGRPTETLTMTRRGDLVFAEGAHRLWHSATSVKGSYLRLRGDGRLVVLTPAGNVVWHSAALGPRAVLSVVPVGWFQLIGAVDGCWLRPSGASHDCDR